MNKTTEHQDRVKLEKEQQQQKKTLLNGANRISEVVARGF